MGWFGESKQDKLLRYVETTKTYVKEHDRTYFQQIKYIHEDFKTLKPDQFDPKVKIKEFNISPVGMFKYRFLGACIVLIGYSISGGDLDDLIGISTGICNLTDVDDVDSPPLFEDRNDLTAIYDTIVLDYTKYLSSRDVFEISKLHIDALGDSIGETFVGSSINQNALKIQSLAVAENLVNAINQKWE